jgi:multidrug efflux pump subunit AcrA (membrane-fusion protein)
MVYHQEEKSKPRSSMMKLGRIVALLVLIIGGIFLFHYRDSLSTQMSKVLAATEDDPIPVTKLSRQPFLLTVPSTGEVVGLETTPVPTPNTPSGSLKLSWLIPEGTFVREGEAVIRFDSTDAKLTLEKQQNSLEANQQNTKIKTLKQATDEKTLGFDRTSAELEYNYDMTVMPDDETIFSKWDIITAQADANYDKARIEFLGSKTKTQQRIARSDQQILAIERNRAQSEISIIQTTLNSLELRVTKPGLVLYRRDRRQDPKIGDDCQPGQVLVELVNLEVLQARIYVLERDGGNLSKDQPVVIKLDAIPEKEYHGTLRNVSTVAGALERNSPLRYFTCDVSISDAGKDLKRIRPGMNLRGEIVLEKYDSCFVVPSSAVNYREKERDSLVYVKKGEKFVAQPVKTGLSSHGEAVILSGVDDGVLIALRNPFEQRKLYLPDFNKGASSQDGRMRGGMPPDRGMMMQMMGGGGGRGR